MTNIQHEQAEVRRINSQIAGLEAKRDLILKKSPSEWLLQHMLPGEKPNARNLDKLIALAHIKNYLQQEQNRDGVQTKDIFKYLNDSIGLDIKPATLRSYLSRYKSERRIAFDKTTRTWRLPAEMN